MSFLQDPRTIGLVAMGGLLFFYYQRVNRAKEIKLASATSQPVAKQLTESSKYPFVSAKDRINDPTVWKVDLSGHAREGQYGLERRDYKDPVGGTKVVTHTDAWVNV